MKLTRFVLVSALALVPALAQAQDKDAKGNARQLPRPHASPGVRSAQERMTDARLIALVHRVNQEEVEAGILAQRKGTATAVKEYGRKLVADHTRADQELLAAAKKVGLAPNDSELSAHDKEMMRVDKNTMEQLQKMSGADFDKAFAQEMSRDHEHMISMLRDGKSDLSAPMRELVDQTVPMLEEHKDLADKAAKASERRSEARRAQPIQRR